MPWRYFYAADSTTLKLSCLLRHRQRHTFTSSIPLGLLSSYRINHAYYSVIFAAWRNGLIRRTDKDILPTCSFRPVNLVDGISDNRVYQPDQHTNMATATFRFAASRKTSHSSRQLRGLLTVSHNASKRLTVANDFSPPDRFRVSWLTVERALVEALFLPLSCGISVSSICKCDTDPRTFMTTEPRS
jgi:hypothetical protein